MSKEEGRGSSRQGEEVRWRMGKFISVLYCAALILESDVSNGCVTKVGKRMWEHLCERGFSVSRASLAESIAQCSGAST